MNPQIFNDEHFRKAIQWTVCLIVFCCIVSQIMMQLAGGERDEPLDLSGQVPRRDARQWGIGFRRWIPSVCIFSRGTHAEKNRVQSRIVFWRIDDDFSNL